MDAYATEGSTMRYISDISAAEDSAARRAAKRAGLRIVRSRWRRYSCDNYGGYQLINANRNWIVAGERFDLTPDDVIDWCTTERLS